MKKPKIMGYLHWQIGNDSATYHAISPIPEFGVTREIEALVSLHDYEELIELKEVVSADRVLYMRAFSKEVERVKSFMTLLDKIARICDKSACETEQDIYNLINDEYEKLSKAEKEVYL